jgi:ribosomal protein S8
VCELGIVMPQAANIGDRPLPMPSPPRKVDQGKEQSSEPLRRQSKEQSKQHQEQDGRSIFTNKHLLHSPSNEPRQPFARKTHLTGHRGHTTTAMSLVNLAHVCSHLQNASLARLGLTSIPHTRLHLSVALLLQKQGFFSQVKLGGPSPPASCFPPGLRDEGKVHAGIRARSAFAEKDRETALSRMVMQRATPEQLIAEGFNEVDVQWASLYATRTPAQLQEEGVPVEAMGLTIENQPLTLTSDENADLDDLDTEGVVTQANRASRRLWLGLKYWDGLPVLHKAQMISKPTKRIWLNSTQLGIVVRGGRAGEVKGMTQVGEMMAVSTDRGVMEARECVERKIGGMPLCRVW